MLVIILVLLLTMPTHVFAANNIKVILDGKDVSANVFAQVSNGEVLVSATDIYGALGAITTYNRDTQKLTIKYGQYWYLSDMPNHKDSDNNTINEFTIGKNEYDTIMYESKGTAYHFIKWLASPPSIIDNNIMLSAKDFVGLLDYEVNWDATTKTLLLSKKWNYISITPWYSELNYLLEYNPNIQNMVTGETYPSTYISTPPSTISTGSTQNFRLLQHPTYIMINKIGSPILEK